MKQSPAQVARTGSMRITQAEFLRLFEEGHHTASALRAIGRTRRTFDRHWLLDPIFREQYEAAKARKAGRGEEGFKSTDFINFRRMYFGHETPAHQALMAEAITSAEPDSVTLVLAPPEAGKGLALDTPLPTPTGWTTMGEVAVGDDLLDETGNPTVVTAVSAVHHLPCYRMTFTNGESVVCDDEHLWLTRTRKPQHGESVKRTDEIAATVEAHGRPNHGVPVTAPLNLPDADFLIDPYVLGAWLGDGTSATGQFTVSTGDAEHLVAELSAAGEWPSTRSYAYSASTVTVTCGTDPSICYRGHPKTTPTCAACSHLHYRKRKYGEPMPPYPFGPLETRLRALGLLNNKHIPEAYLRASEKQRWALLQGLMDTDGTCDRKGRSEFTTTKPAMAEGFAELVNTLGLKFGRFEGRATIAGRGCGPYWCFSICAPASTPLFRLPRKAERQHPEPPNDRARWRVIAAVESVPTVPTRCIAVDSPSRLYLCSRSMIPTHNTTKLIDLYCYLLGTDPNYRICVLSENQDFARKIIGQVSRRMTDRAFFSGYIERFGPFRVNPEDKKRSGTYDRDVRKPWNADYITVLKASHDEKEPSLESKGATSQIYGARYDLIVCDDLVSLRNVNQSAEIFDKLRQEAITRLSEKGKLIVIGTRVRSGDLYELMLEEDDDEEDGGRFVDNFISIPALDRHGNSYWPERWPVERLERRKAKVRADAWERVYMQRPVSREGATFDEEVVRRCCDTSLSLGTQAGGTEVLGSLDPALAGPAAFGIWSYDATRLWLVDVEVRDHLGSNEAIFRHLARLSGRYRPGEWVIEQDGQGNKALVADERLRELAAAHGFRIHPHVTTGNKSSHAYGVAAMATAFVKREIVLPYGDVNSRRKVDALIEELIRWRADVPTRLITQDRVMQTWFAWRLWLGRRKVVSADAAGFNTRGLPWKPTTGGLVMGRAS